MEQSYWQEFMQGSKNILLLQGPIGPFFHQLSQFLEKEHEKTVYKVNFNGGDAMHYPPCSRSFQYYGSVDEFETFLLTLIEQYSIDSVVCFGHKRAYHIVAKKLCLQREGLNFWAFEEGYLRPHYITFEKWGVNNDSKVPTEASFYTSEHFPIIHEQPPLPVASGFWPKFNLAMDYYMGMYFCRDHFPEYQHHRETKVMTYIGAWLLSFWRSYVCKPKEKWLARQIADGQFGEFFIVPLQVHNDSQVRTFGEGMSVPSFIRAVLASFAKHAPKDHNIILKHHPMDRGFNHYGLFIRKLAKRYGIEGRVQYVLDIPMPIFLRQAKGMVLINSTSGLSALLHGMPVKVLGKAPYDFEGLADQQPLESFWQHPKKPEMKVFKNYRLYLLYKTQLNANFYRGGVHVSADLEQISNKI